MAGADPPGTTYIPGLRENMYGLFTINIGVYVPEVAVLQHGRGAKNFAHEYNCCVRTRLGANLAENQDTWWRIVSDAAVVESVVNLIRSDAMPFFERFGTREKILKECYATNFDRMRVPLFSPPKIVCGIILAERGEIAKAHKLLAEQFKENETEHPGHAEHVQGLAAKMGLPDLALPSEIVIASGSLSQN